MASIDLRSEHGLVLATALGGYFVHNMWMAIKVGQARKKYGVTYPTLYASADHPHANAFNCVQRGHQNSLEYLPSFYMLLLTAGARYPISASIAGAIYLAGKVAYFNGYSTGDPKARMRGTFGYIGAFGLLGMVARWSFSLLSPLLH